LFYNDLYRAVPGKLNALFIHQTRFYVSFIQYDSIIKVNLYQMLILLGFISCHIRCQELKNDLRFKDFELY